MDGCRPDAYVLMVLKECRSGEGYKVLYDLFQFPLFILFSPLPPPSTVKIIYYLYVNISLNLIILRFVSLWVYCIMTAIRVKMSENSQKKTYRKMPKWNNIYISKDSTNTFQGENFIHKALYKKCHFGKNIGCFCVNFSL